MRINIGSIGAVPEELDKGLVSPDYIVFRSETLDPNFLVALLRSPFYRMYIDVVTTGSIRDRLYFSDLRKLHVPDVDPMAQVQVCEHGRRIEEEERGLLDVITAERGKSADRLHGLVKAAAASADDAAGTEEAFRALADQWRRETGLHSSPAKKIRHPAYQKIIEMGESAVPLILRELQDRPAHWFAALKAITGASPLPEGERADMRAAAEAWIEWGKQKGYIKAGELRADASEPGERSLFSEPSPR